MKIIIYLKLSLILAILAQMQAFSQSFSCTPIEEFRFNGKKSDSIFSVPIPRSHEGVTHMFIRTGDPSKYNFCQMSENTGELLKVIKTVDEYEALRSKYEYMQDTNFIIGTDIKANIRIYNTNTGDNEIITVPGGYIKYLAFDNSIIYRDYSSDTSNIYFNIYKYDLKKKTTIAKFEKPVRMVNLTQSINICTNPVYNAQAYFAGNYLLLQSYDIFDHGRKDVLTYQHKYDHYMQCYLIDVRDMSLVYTFVDTLIREDKWFPNYDQSTHYPDLLLDTLRYNRVGFSDDGCKIAMVPFNLKYTLDVFDIRTLTKKRYTVPYKIYERGVGGLAIFFDSTNNYVISKADYVINNVGYSDGVLVYNYTSNESVLIRNSHLSNWESYFLPWIKYKNSNSFLSSSKKKSYLRIEENTNIAEMQSINFNLDSNKLYIINKDNKYIEKIEIFDIQSHLVYSISGYIPSEIDFNFASGAYIIKATIDGNIETYKIIKY